MEQIETQLTVCSYSQWVCGTQQISESWQATSGFIYKNNIQQNQLNMNDILTVQCHHIHSTPGSKFTEHKESDRNDKKRVNFIDFLYVETCKWKTEIGSLARNDLHFKMTVAVSITWTSLDPESLSMFTVWLAEKDTPTGATNKFIDFWGWNQTVTSVQNTNTVPQSVIISLTALNKINWNSWSNSLMESFIIKT